MTVEKSNSNRNWQICLVKIPTVLEDPSCQNRDFLCGCSAASMAFDKWACKFFRACSQSNNDDLASSSIDQFQIGNSAVKSRNLLHMKYTGKIRMGLPLRSACRRGIMFLLVSFTIDLQQQRQIVGASPSLSKAPCVCAFLFEVKGKMRRRMRYFWAMSILVTQSLFLTGTMTIP